MRHWAVEAYIPFWTKGRDSRGEAGNSLVGERANMVNKFFLGHPETRDTEKQALLDFFLFIIRVNSYVLG